MKKTLAILICLLLAAVLFSSCGQVESPEPTEAPPVNIVQREDTPDPESLLPLHVQSGTSLVRIYYSGGEAAQRVMSKSFVFYYGGMEYTVFKYYKQENILYFAGDYTVNKGEVLCTLYRYSGGELTMSVENVLAQSVVFADYPAVAYIAMDSGQTALKYCIKDIDQIVTVDTGVSQCAFVNRYNQIVYLRRRDEKSELMFFDTVNQPVSLGESGPILQVDAADGRVITAPERKQTVIAEALNITVYYPLEGISYRVQNVLEQPTICVNGYVIAGGSLVYLSAGGASTIAPAGVMYAVKGDQSVIFISGNNCAVASGGQAEQLKCAGMPLEAFRVRGKLYYRTSSGFYDGQTLLCNPAKVVLTQDSLYVSVNNPDGITCDILYYGAGQQVASGALKNTPFYVLGSRVYYFVRMSLTDDALRLVSQGVTILENAGMQDSIYGNSILSELAVLHRDGSLILLKNGTAVITVPEGKIRL